MMVTIYHSEPRPPQVGKTVQWTVFSGERRELGRAAARQHALLSGASLASLEEGQAFLDSLRSPS